MRAGVSTIIADVLLVVAALSILGAIVYLGSSQNSYINRSTGLIVRSVMNVHLAIEEIAGLPNQTLSARLGLPVGVDIVFYGQNLSIRIRGVSNSASESAALLLNHSVRANDPKDIVRAVTWVRKPTYFEINITYGGIYFESSEPFGNLDIVFLSTQGSKPVGSFRIYVSKGVVSRE